MISSCIRLPPTWNISSSIKRTSQTFRAQERRPALAQYDTIDMLWRPTPKKCGVIPLVAFTTFSKLSQHTTGTKCAYQERSQNARNIRTGHREDDFSFIHALMVSTVKDTESSASLRRRDGALRMHFTCCVQDDDDDDTRASRKIPQRNAIPRSHAKLKQNCDPVLGAFGPSPALSNPDKDHMPSASLPISHYVSCISRSDAGRVSSRSPAFHT